MPVSIDITEAELKNAIAVALAESFSGERRDALLRDIVRAHLTHKESQYDKQTMLAKHVGQAIRKMASEALMERLESMKPDVYQIVGEMLGEPFRESVYEHLRNALRHVIVSGISVSATLSDDE